jgi:hypothetical protein
MTGGGMIRELARQGDTLKSIFKKWRDFAGNQTELLMELQSFKAEWDVLRKDRRKNIPALRKKRKQFRKRLITRYMTMPIEREIEE